MRRNKVTGQGNIWVVAIWTLTLTLAASGTVLARSSDYYPPRVSEVDGGAGYEPAGDVDWDELTVNLPLLVGDRVFSHQDSRVEIEFEGANFVRLGAETDLSVSYLSDKEAGLELTLGEVIIRMNHSRKFRITTPSGTIEIKKKGLYRVAVDESGNGRLTVRKGKATLETPNEKQTVKSDEAIAFGPQPDLQYTSSAYSYDAFDSWSDRRDAQYVRSTSVSYIGGGYYPGVYALDRYGYWDSFSSYGRVWFPYVSAGWAPFRSGFWLNFSFGPTWISYEPWGWLPYHSGSWVYYQPYRRWGWVPRGYRHWHPGPVHFFAGGGYVGWAPWRYRDRNIYGGNTTIINNNTIINNVGGRPGRGLTVARNQDFGRGRIGNGAFSEPSRRVASSLRPALSRDVALLSDSNRRRTAGSRSPAIARRQSSPAQSFRGSRGAAPPAVTTNSRSAPRVTTTRGRISPAISTRSRSSSSVSRRRPSPEVGSVERNRSRDQSRERPAINTTLRQQNRRPNVGRETRSSSSSRARSGSISTSRAARPDRQVVRPSSNRSRTTGTRSSRSRVTSRPSTSRSPGISSSRRSSPSISRSRPTYRSSSRSPSGRSRSIQRSSPRPSSSGIRRSAPSRNSGSSRSRSTNRTRRPNN